MRSTVRSVLCATAPSLPSRSIATSSSLLFPPRSRTPPSANANVSAMGDGESSLPNAHVKPKVFNSNIWGSGSDPGSQLTEEQKREVDQHNRYFAKKQSPGNKEKVDNKFWKGSHKS